VLYVEAKNYIMLLVISVRSLFGFYLYVDRGIFCFHLRMFFENQSEDLILEDMTCLDFSFYLTIKRRDCPRNICDHLKFVPILQCNNKLHTTPQQRLGYQLVR